MNPGNCAGNHHTVVWTNSWLFADGIFQWIFLMMSYFDSNYAFRVESWFAPSQWETSLQSNAVSHWLSANVESALRIRTILAQVMARCLTGANPLAEWIMIQFICVTRPQWVIWCVVYSTFQVTVRAPTNAATVEWQIISISVKYISRSSIFLTSMCFLIHTLM